MRRETDERKRGGDRVRGVKPYMDPFIFNFKSLLLLFFIGTAPIGSNTIFLYYFNILLRVLARNHSNMFSQIVKKFAKNSVETILLRFSAQTAAI